VISAKGLRTRLGSPYPLGATWDGAGVNCALLILDTRAWEAREATGARRSLALLRLRRARGGA